MAIVSSSTQFAPFSSEYKERCEQTLNRREGFWFPEPERERLLAYLDQLANSAPRQRERSIAIIAEANNGKSALLKRYMERHPSSEEKGRKIVKCISVDMSNNKRVEDLSVALLRALGDINPEGGNHSQRIIRFIALSRKTGLQLTFLDEFHEAANLEKGGPILRCIKGLMNEHVKIVPLGLESLQKVFIPDPEFSTRFAFSRGRLKRISNTGMIKALMMNISELPEHKIESKAVKYVLKVTKGVMGHMCDLIEETFVDSGNLTLASLVAQRDNMDCLNTLV